MDHLSTCDHIPLPTRPSAADGPYGPDGPYGLDGPHGLDGSDPVVQPDRGRDEGLDTESLRRLVATQPVIEQAKGMLMGYYGIEADRAFALLVRWSSRRQVKVRELAHRLVDAAAVPDPRPFGALGRVLAQVAPEEDAQV